jgi:hypothetical protein
MICAINKELDYCKDFISKGRIWTRISIQFGEPWMPDPDSEPDPQRCDYNISGRSSQEAGKNRFTVYSRRKLHPLIMTSVLI